MRGGSICVSDHARFSRNAEFPEKQYLLHVLERYFIQLTLFPLLVVEQYCVVDKCTEETFLRDFLVILKRISLLLVECGS